MNDRQERPHTVCLAVKQQHRKEETVSLSLDSLVVTFLLIALMRAMTARGVFFLSECEDEKWRTFHVLAFFFVFVLVYQRSEG